MSSIKAALVASAALFVASPAFAQFGGSPIITGGSFTAGGTANQIQYYGTNGQFAGFTMSGDCTVTVATGVMVCGQPFGEKVTAFTSTTGSAAINLPQGATPSSPANGDMWTTSSGLFVQIAGSTVGPLNSGTGCIPGAGTAGRVLVADGSSGCTLSNLLLAGASGKTLTVNNTLTLAGTDATTMTFPTTSATIARTDTTQTFSGTQGFNSVINMGSGAAINVLAMKAVIATAPSAPAAGCGSTTAVSNANGTLSFTLTIGGTGITSACQFTLPAASHSWHCWGDDITTATEVLHQTALATNSATLTFYAITTGLATAPTTGDVILASCLGN